jgi:DNA repair exonuclease SbcCD ATPase subunit
MAEVTGFGLDLSSFIAQADKADRKILNMVQHAQQLQNVLTNALNGATTASFTSIMDRLTSQVDNINNKKVSPNFNTQEAEKLYGIMNNVAQVMQILGQNKVPLFDTQNVYATNQGLFTAQDNLSKINNEITKLNEEWKKQGASTFTPVKFAIPKYEPLINDKTGKAYGKNTQAQQQHRAEYDEKIKLLREWEAAYNKHQEQIFNQEKKNSQLAIELELRELIEKKAIASEELKWAKMTQDEKTQYVLKKMAEELNIEEKKINEVRKNYRSYLSEMNTLSSQIERNQRKDVNGVTAEQIETQKARFLQLDTFKRELETNYGAFLVDIAEKANARAANITAERLRREADAKKAEEEAQWQKYLSSPEGALTLAKDAKTINQMKEAQKYLQEARGNVDVEDTKTIKTLNDEYIRLRATIEKLTTAEKNEQSLQPTLANEYRRLLKELDQVRRSREALSKTKAFQAGDVSAKKAYNDLITYEQQLNNKKVELRKAAGDALIPIEQEHAARIAQITVTETEKAERVKFESERKRLLEIQELRRQTATRSTARANQIVDQSENVKNIAQEEQAVKRLEDARRRLNKNDADYEVTLKRINDAIAQHTHNIKMATDASYREAQAKKQAQQQNTTYQGAMDYSKNVKSINDQIKAIEYLKQARANLDRTSMSKSEYEKQIKALTLEIQKQQKEVDRLTGKSSNLKNGMGKLGNVVQQLKSQLTALFGVAAIKGYIQKLVDVRSEFERQQTALEGILQSKDEADKLWSQTTQLALKSPFSIRELITYTKQLSAYRIETDKLHDTTKQLADVSAGLGVDMSRLILAYGQVRAAEYLRGTELRQFTEAGIPMLEELARYFTEVEGRAISTADVFDMISKRMIEFEDVAEVFNRMTSEGGVFFEMQEQQSKTLYGELSNLKDAYELMLNEIGENNEGVIKNAIQQARNLLQSWKDVAFALKIALPAFAAVKTSMYLYKLGTKNAATTTLWFNKALKSNIGASLEMIRTLKWSETTMMGVTKTQFLLGRATLYVQGAVRGLLALIKTFAPFAIIAGISYLIEKLTEASRKAEELRQNLNEIIYSDKSNLDDTIEEYKNLYSRLELVNKGSIEHSNIISKLNSQYGEYLDFVVNENTTIQQLADSYDTLVERMTATAQLKSYEKSIGEIHEQSKKEIADAVEDYNFFMKRGFEQSDNPLFKLIPTKKEIDNIYAIIRQKIRETNVEQLDNYGEQANFLNKIINEFYGKELNPFSSTYLPPIVDELIKVKKQEKIIQEEINALYTKTYKTQEQLMRFEQIKNEFAEKKRQIEKSLTNEFEKQKELQKLKDQEAIEVINLEFELGLRSRKNADDAIEEITNWMKPLTQSINDAIKLNLSELYSEEELSKVLINKDLQNNKSISNYITNVKNEWEITNKLILEQISLKSAGHKIDEKHLAKLQKREQLYRRTAEIAGVELKYTQRMNEETRQAINSMFDDNLVITLEEAWGGFDNVLKNLNEKANEQELIIRQLNKHKKEGLPIDEQALENAEQLFVWTKKRLALLDPKSDKKINEHRLQEINERLEKEYRIDIIDSQKSESQLLADANSEKEKAIAYEKQLLDIKKEGLSVTDQELSDAKKAVEQTTLKWDLLGGEEEVKEPKKRTLKETIDDAIRIVKDAHDDYKKVSKTIDHTAAKTLALAKNANAFAEAVKGIPSLAKFKLDDFAFDQEDGAIESLEKLKTLIPTTAKNYKSLMVDIEKAIGDLRGEATIEAKVKADEELIQSIEEMFDGYELSLELDKLGLPKNFMSDLFNIDTFDLDQIRTKIENEISRIKSSEETKQGEKDRLKELEKQLQKVDDMEEKQMQERLKKYSKYLLKSQSEAVKIKLEELRQLEEIESLSDVSNAHKKAMRQGVRDEAQQKLGKATWDTFKDSDMYIRLFEDLESQSTRSLNRMREELKKYRNSLKELDDPTALKEISERIESLDEQIAKRNPFKGLSEAYKKFRETRKQLGGEKELELLLDKNRQEESLLQSEVDAKHLKINEAELRLNEALKTGDTFKIALAKSLLRVEENELETLLAQLDAQKEITQEQADALSEQQDAKKEFEDSLSGLGNKIAEYTSALPEIMNDLEAMGVSVDESLKDAAESAAEIGEGVNSIMQGFASNNPLAVIQGITKTGAAISRIFDKSEERRIQRRIEKIEDLSRAYETLQKRIENAYSIGEFRSSYDESYQNIDKQIQAYEDMIAAEEDKKKSDKERIKEWKQAQEDLEQQKKELQDQQLQELGGFGESGVKDAAQQFVDAWMDAFQETGDGLSGLEDKWDEYIKNVIRKQMALKVSDHFIKNITDEVDKALKDDSNLSAEELAKINQMADEALPALSEALQKIANEYGGSALSPSVGELSGLTQGIQGITEQTADQLAGLVNSIRLLVADNYKELVNIANALGTSTQVENPMVGQLKIIASHTNNINSLLESVVTSSTSGRGIRVITQV